jgi:hypothetical protein
MTEAEVMDATRNWIATLTGITWIDSYQSGPEPAEPYGVINLMNADAVYQNPIENEFPAEMIDDPDNPGTEIEQVSQAPVRDWRWNFSLNVYGGAGATILRKIKVAEKVPTALRTLRPLLLFSTSQVRPIPELVNEAWQARSQIDIEIRGIVRDGIVIDVAETADVIFTPV